MMASSRLVLVGLLAACAAGIFLALRAGRWTKPSSQHFEVIGANYPLRVHNAQGTLSIERAPQRILPAFASAIDLLVELVPIERIVALPNTAREWSVLAEAHADWLSLPELASFSAEEVLALKPDLVLVQSWLGASTIASLQRHGVALLELPLPSDWPGILASVRALATIVGEPERGEALLASLEARRQALAERRAKRWRALCYSNWGSGGTTAGSDSTGDLLLELAGLSNAARELGLRGNPSIDHESLLRLAPELFVVANAPNGSLSPSSDYLLNDAHLAKLPAIQAGRIVTLPMQLFSTGSQRVLDAAEELARAVDALDGE